MPTREELVKTQQVLMERLAQVNRALNDADETDKVVADIVKMMKDNQYVLITETELVIGSKKNYIIVKGDEFAYEFDDWGNLHITQGVKLVFFCDDSGRAFNYKTQGSNKFDGSWDIGNPEINKKRILEGRFSGITPDALKTLVRVNMASAYKHIFGNSLNVIENNLKMTIGLPIVEIED